MKTKARSRITSLLVATALAVGLVAVPSTALTASAAAGIETANQAAFKNPVDNAGTTTYQAIYFGQRDVGGTMTPIQWRVLESTSGELFLLSEAAQTTRIFGHNWAYGGVDLRFWLNSLKGNLGNNAPVDYEATGFLSSFSEAEIDTIAAQETFVSGNMANAALTPNSTGDKVFLLSKEEVGSLQYFPNEKDDRKTGGNWWLRSAGFNNNNAAIVNDVGNVNSFGIIVHSNYGIRPALKIHLSSVIFSSSAASGGKPTTVGANLSAAQQPTGAVKLTVKDPSQTLNVIATTAQQSQSGSALAFSYDGATTGERQTVSCVLEQSGVVKYYGKLEDTSNAASGSLSIPLTGVANGTYKLRIFSEQDNGTNKTDFASAPIDMTVKVTSGSGTVSNFGGTALKAPTITGGATATTDSISLFEGYDQQTKTYTIAGTPTPTVVVTDAQGTGATFNAGLLSIPAGLTKGSYTIVLTATNGEGNATMTVSLTVNYAPASITAQPVNAIIIEGSNASFTVTATGSTPITYQWEESSNNGSTWNTIAGETNSTLTLTAVPITSNGKQYHCVVDNVLVTPVTSNAATLTVLVTPTTPTITGGATATTDSISLIEGYTAQTKTYTIAGTPAPTVVVTDAQGTGATFNAGVLNIPTGLTKGSYTIVLTATNGEGNATMTVTVNVLEVPTAPAITTNTLPNGTEGTAYSQTLAATGTAPITWSLDSGSLPAGLNLSSSGVISGTPTTTGSVSFTVKAANGTAPDATKALTIVIDPVGTPPPTGTSHTITLGASGDGTVTGGGSYAENDTATVIATPNTGWRFVQWTENGVAVSQSASYSFTVTAARTLTAVFEEIPTAPEPPVITTPSGGGSSSSSGGSNKPDVAPVASRPFTKAEATKLFNTALAAKPEEQTTLSIKARGYTKVDKTVLAELAALAQKNGVTLTVHFDTVVGKAVAYRLSVNPATIQTDLDLTAKLVGSKLTLPKFPVPVEVAVKLPVDMTIETLKITQNGKDVTATAKPWLDKVGYLHFTTTGGEMVLGK